MTASASFAAASRIEPDAVLVRMSALVAASTGPDATGRTPLAVFVVDEGGRATERRVKTGDFIRSSVVVTGGVEPGERVVVVGASLLQDGEVVDARPYAAERRD
ncbi:MAG: hypothetical protein M5U12_05860 [Verrucomicrobia bacterium]|nr:hypothetical protein [Verrucomicrobiota bacterium]